MQQAGRREAAEAWCSNAAAWTAQLQDAFPDYQDLTQPVARAVLEGAHGLRLAAAAVASLAPLPLPRPVAPAVAGGGRQRVLDIAHHLMAFPRPCLWPRDGGAPFVPASPATQSLAAAVAASASPDVSDLPQTSLET